jgi:hypothetical protein
MGQYNDLSVFLGKETKDQPNAEWKGDALYRKVTMGKKVVVIPFTQVVQTRSWSRDLAP